ncbi:MAG: AMP-binding protein, partial [Planctomycetota bacterium]|nr:AMP-binding protein [Planctomycetota bacterium]
MNLDELLSNAAGKYPHNCAVIDEAGVFDFAQVQAGVSQESSRLCEMINGTGERVAIFVSNRPAFSVFYFAILQAGGIAVPLNVLYSDEEIVSILTDCQASVLVVESAYAKRCLALKPKILNCKIIEVPSNPLVGISGVESELLPRIPRGDISSDETAVILYTSGTTGEPKGVELTHTNLVSNAKCVSQEKFSTREVKNILGPGDVGLAALPLAHAFGQTNMQNGLWFSGAAIAYCPRFEATQVIQQMMSRQVTFFAGVPTMYFDLVSAGRELKRREGFAKLSTSLKFCVCGGAELDKSIKQEFTELFGVSIQESYGLTETSPMISCQTIDRTEKSGSVGKPISNVKIRIVDRKNEIVGRGIPGE